MTEANTKTPDQMPWQQELLPHTELQGILKETERVVLIGSVIEGRASAVLERYEEGSYTSAQYDKHKRTTDAALDILSRLDVTDTRFLDALQEEQDRMEITVEHLNIDDRTARYDALKLINKEFTNLDDQIRSLTKVKSAKHGNLRSPALAINDIILAHNTRVSEAAESNPAPTAQPQSQPQVNSQERYQQEQKRLAQQRETEADARSKVAEAHGETGEAGNEGILSSVLQAAKGNTRIYTDMPQGAQFASKQGMYKPIDGFNSFGDGLDQNNGFRMTKLEHGGSAEAFIMAPDMAPRFKTIDKEVSVRGRFGIKKTETRSVQVPDGEDPVMIKNPVTGVMELGVKAAYQFNGNMRRIGGQSMHYEGPIYRTQTGRGGNQLFVEVTLPQSVATELQQKVTENPYLAREFARLLAQQNGVTPQLWQDTVSPPYAQLPSDWYIANVTV